MLEAIFFPERYRLVTAIEESSEGLRVCLGARYLNDWYLIADHHEAQEMRRAWAQAIHIYITAPNFRGKR
jgi:hypothetical protein